MKIALSAAALALCAGAAMAADLPSIKDPPPVYAPPPTWTGFYVGLNAGGTWSDNNSPRTSVFPAFFDPGFPFGGTNPRHLFAFSIASSGFGDNNSNGGFIGGGQIGYNWQFWNSFVAGIEADIQGVAASSQNRAYASAASAPVFGLPTNYIGLHDDRAKVDYLGTVRGRVGYLLTPTLLLFGSGGLAYGGVSSSTGVLTYHDLFPSPQGAAASAKIPASFGGTFFSDTRVGWTAGGGVEWMFLPRWSAKVEYLYYDLGTVRTTFAMLHQETSFRLNAVHAGESRTRFNGNIVRAGVNYHFSWGSPAPILAKY